MLPQWVFDLFNSQLACASRELERLAQTDRSCCGFVSSSGTVVVLLVTNVSSGCLAEVVVSTQTSHFTLNCANFLATHTSHQANGADVVGDTNVGAFAVNSHAACTGSLTVTVVHTSVQCSSAHCVRGAENVGRSFGSVNQSG